MKKLSAKPRRLGFTLLELLLVVTLIGVLVIPLYLSYTRTQANQGLRSTTEQLENILTQAHVFAREARDKKSWGVVRDSENSYSLVSGAPSQFSILQSRSAEPFVSFPKDFSVWFDIGTGDTSSEQIIIIKNKFDVEKKIRVSKNGVIEEIQNAK